MVASEGPYDETSRDQVVTYDVPSTPPGRFEFEIKDSFGDGLGSRTYTVSMNGDVQIQMSDYFGNGFGETQEFGSLDMCNPIKVSQLRS